MPSNDTTAPIVIIGGGIMGCATAYNLARRGVTALVLDKSAVAAEGSGLNAGGVRAQCRDRRERPLALASVALWPQLADLLDADVEYARSGNIRLASTEERLARLQAEGEEEQADGLAVELWDRDTLYRRAPYLGDGFVGAKYCATDGVAHPIRTTRAFAHAALRHGAQIRAHTAVTAIHARDGAITGVTARHRGETWHIETPLVLHAAGPWTPQLAEPLGVDVPVRSIRLPMAATEPITPPFAPFLSSHDRGVAARPTPRGEILVSGFGDPNPTFAKHVTDADVATLRRVEQMVPALRGIPFARTWAGLLDVTSDEVPITGPVDGVTGYWLATGWSGHGFCLGPIMGQLLAEWIIDGAPSLDLNAFHLSRFADPQRAWEMAEGSSVIADRLTR